MPKIVWLMLIVGIAAFVALMFQERSPQETPGPAATQTAPHDHAPPGEAMAFTGKVIETVDAGGYTYIQLDTGREKIWAAGPETPVETGAVVAIPAGMQMADFKSETLNRTFETIYFVSEIRTGGDTAAQLPEGHPQIPPPDVGTMDASGIDVPAGGKTIAALYAERVGLAGREVVVRGRVVKITSSVMNKNWVHLRDGTGTEGTNDLTVTTDAVVNVGDIVVVKGVLAVEKDFGMGYAYDILLENADVTVEHLE